MKCITCLKDKIDDTGKILYQKLYVCDDCVHKILTVYLYTNNFKWICAKCESNPEIKCEWCDLNCFLKEIKCL